MNNPGNFRTFTLTEEQTFYLIECVEDKVEELKEAASVAAIQTKEEINGMLNRAWELDRIKDILDA